MEMDICKNCHCLKTPDVAHLIAVMGAFMCAIIFHIFVYSYEYNIRNQNKF